MRDDAAGAEGREGRLAVLRDALARADALDRRSPGWSVLASILAQLRYLIDLETGRRVDRARLGDIILGVQAAREIETVDMALADLLHQVSAGVRRMR